MKNLFNSVQLFKPKSNVFDLSHDVKMSLDMGKLYPTLALECVPGDKFTLGCESLLRFAPLIAPVMHRFDVSMHYFFVPNRLIWDSWEKFITGSERGFALNPITEPVVAPYITVTQAMWDTYPLLDYMGIPRPIGEPAGADSYNISPLQFAAYQMIYDAYYRDQNLIAPINFGLGQGDNSADVANFLPLRTRAWEHDYFTGALPFAQKGEAVGVPMGVAPVYFQHNDSSADDNLSWNTTVTPGAGTVVANADRIYNEDVDNIFPAVGENEPYADLSKSTGTINDLRRAFRLQEWLEKNARAGTRYVENILAHFGVRSPDMRLDRPEYITGIKTPVVVSEVLNTTGEDAGLPQGNMAGHAVSVTSGKYGKYFCQEHGFIIGIMSVMPKSAYQDGIHRSFLKTDRFDYYWPEFANIGEQEIKNIELYANGVEPNGTFGYVPRYAEYKYMPSRVAGDFRDSLDFWHMGRIIAGDPALNAQFIECNPGKRIFAVETTENSLYAHVLHKIRAVRCMPKYGTPSF